MDKQQFKNEVMLHAVNVLNQFGSFQNMFICQDYDGKVHVLNGMPIQNFANDQVFWDSNDNHKRMPIMEYVGDFETFPEQGNAVLSILKADKANPKGKWVTIT